jgi:hypothetical protein
LAAALLLGCSAGRPSPGERRICFSDDLRVHSLRPDGTGLFEFSGKHSLHPLCGPGGRIFFGSYRGPYWLVDEPRPGLYSSDAAGRNRRRLADLSALPLPFGISRDGSVGYLLPGRPALFFSAADGSGIRERTLPGTPVAAAVDPEGKRTAVLLEARMRTVVLGNQAWFTEGHDLLVVDLGSEKAVAVEYPLLPEELEDRGRLEHYAGSGAAAVAWRGGEELLVASAPGVWAVRLQAPSTRRLVVPRGPGHAPPDGLSVSKSGTDLAYTCSGRLFLRDIPSGRERDLTPAGVLVGGAHHPCWMEP